MSGVPVVIKQKSFMENKSVERTLLDRRSIRRYEREVIPAEDMQFIYDAIRNTPTSYNGQQFSVIDVVSQEKKEALYEIIGQKQIKTCNHFLVFCMDYNKISKLAAAKGVEMPEFVDTMDGVTVGIIDASLALMSAMVAAESRGLGTNAIGYARTANPAAVSKMLNLPKGVFVVCGLAIGVPREVPDLKPKMPLSAIIHTDSYNDEGLVETLEKYDAEIKHYNATRAGAKTDNDWLNHILGYYTEACKYEILKALKDQGFDVKK